MTNTENMGIAKEIREMINIGLASSLYYYLNEANYPADIVRDTIIEYVKEKVDENINEKEHYENVERAKEKLIELYNFCDKNNIVMRDKCTGTEIFEIDVY